MWSQTVDKLNFGCKELYINFGKNQPFAFRGLGFSPPRQLRQHMLLRLLGENWRASYEITDSNLSYTIFYIGNENVPKSIDYAISHNYRGRSLEVKNYLLNEDGLI